MELQCSEITVRNSYCYAGASYWYVLYSLLYYSLAHGTTNQQGADGSLRVAVDDDAEVMVRSRVLVCQAHNDLDG